jgi:hypothetical protein
MGGYTAFDVWVRMPGNEGKTEIDFIDEIKAFAVVEAVDWIKLKLPVIVGGTWWLYDAATDAYADSGVDAVGPQGSPGTQGMTGPRGERGDGLVVKGCYDSLADLQAAHPTGQEGDVYIAGEYLYAWGMDEGAWISSGLIRIGHVVDSLDSFSRVNPLSANMGNRLNYKKADEAPLAVKGITKIQDGSGIHSYIYSGLASNGDAYIHSANAGGIFRWDRVAQALFPTNITYGTSDIYPHSAVNGKLYFVNPYPTVADNWVKVLDDATGQIVSTNLDGTELIWGAVNTGTNTYFYGDTGLYKLNLTTGNIELLINTVNTFRFSAYYHAGGVIPGIYFQTTTGIKFFRDSSPDILYDTNLTTASNICHFSEGPFGDLYVAYDYLGVYKLPRDSTLVFSGRIDSFYPILITKASGLGTDGNVYFSSSNSGLKILKPDGTFESSSWPGGSSIKTIDGITYFGSGMALDPASGEPIQFLPVVDPEGSIAELSDGQICFDNTEGIWTTTLKKYVRQCGRWVEIDV